MQVIKVYLDLPIIGGILGWIQDGTLLWMVAQITGIRVPIKRFVIGGAIGGLFQFLLLTNQASGRVLYSWILTPFLFLLFIPLLMIGVTFFTPNPRKMLRIAGYFYLLSFLLSGIHWGLDSLNNRFLHWNISLFWRFWLHLTFIFLLGELGWGVVHRKIWEQICLYPIEIDWDGKKLKLNALLDTGNRLHDPLTKVPVIIIELDFIKELLPKEVLNLTESLNTGQIENLDLSNYWIERIRILPFNSLGKEHGVLIGFRPDQLKVWQKQQSMVSQNIIVALYNRPLSQEGAFQALIPPAVLKEA